MSWLPLLTWSAISLALQGPDLWAGEPKAGGLVELGSLKSRVPADWVEVKSDDAQVHKQYRLEPVNDDEYHARVTVGLRAKGKRASAVQYVKHWQGMFLPPEGKTMQEAAKIKRLTVKGAAVTYLDVHGDYKGTPGDNTTPRQNFRLLGVYFDTPQGPYEIHLLGPADTVEFYRKGFEDWVKAFK
jgi:hypothetical protein